MFRSYAGSFPDASASHKRPVQWSSCPAAHNQPPVDPDRDVPVCLSGPCLPSSAFPSPAPTSCLASQNADIRATLSSLPLADGQQLLACIDELPEVQGNLLQVLQGLQAKSHSSPGPLLGIMLTYALEVAQAVASLHELGVHHGALTPVAVLLVPREQQQEGQTTNTSALVPAPLRAPGAGAAATAETQLDEPKLPAVQPALRCKLALYGMVNPVEHAGRLAYNAAGWGAVSYLAPECFTSDAAAVTHEALARMDAHAYGALCYHLFTGSAPYHQYHAAQVLVGLSAGGLQLLWPPFGGDGRRPPVPEPIRQLISRCLDRSPETRPAFTEIVSILQAIRREPEAQ